MSNFPPGMSSRDFVRAGIDQPHHHEHEWGDQTGPEFEDDSAIFNERCLYAEGRYGEKWSCEKTRSLECNVERVIKVRDGEPNIAYLASEEDRRNEHRHIERVFDDALVTLESSGGGEIVDLDPANDGGDGFVLVKINSYVIEYRQ